MLDPKDFIITRKRKKYRFALFANSPLCFELSEWKRRAVDSLEIGAGTGFFSVELATSYPDKTFVAVDVKADRLQKGAAEAIARGLTNISFVRARADQVAELVSPHSVQSLWLTFPDPFPKSRSGSRRMTHPTFLAHFAKTLAVSGNFYFKTDARELFLWSLEQLVAQKWQLQELTFDLHESSMPDDYKVETTYEKRYKLEGIPINFLKAKL